jgi:hypothetical protein
VHDSFRSLIHFELTQNTLSYDPKIGLIIAICDALPELSNFIARDLFNFRFYRRVEFVE